MILLPLHLKMAKNLTNKPILLIHKPAGISSAGILNRLKSFLPGKLGHTGTLDPFAEGLIIVLRDKYTKLTPFFSSFPKEYQVQILLGHETDTLDITGKIIRTDHNWKELTSGLINSSLLQLKGVIRYPAPLYSAKKVKGKRLYQYARGNTIVKPPICTSYIYDIHSIVITPPHVTCTIKCSTGTYIRALASLLSKPLNTAVTIKSLKRTAIGQADIKSCLKQIQVFHDLKIHYHDTDLSNFIIEKHICCLTEEEYVQLRQGVPSIRQKVFQKHLFGYPYILLKVKNKESVFIFNPSHFPEYDKPKIIYLQAP